jgi:hypothetical protein
VLAVSVILLNSTKTDLTRTENNHLASIRKEFSVIIVE